MKLLFLPAKSLATSFILTSLAQLVSRCRPFPLLLFRAGAGGGKEVLVVACSSFRVGGMQLTLYVYVVAAKLDENRVSICLKMAMSYCFCCGKSVSDGEEKKRRRLLSSPNRQVSSVLGIEFS